MVEAFVSQSQTGSLVSEACGTDEVCGVGGGCTLSRSWELVLPVLWELAVHSEQMENERDPQGKETFRDRV